MYILAYVTLTILFGLAQSASILIVHPMNMKSHLAFLEPLAEGLAERNHSVTVVSADENGFNENKMEVIRTNDLDYVKLTWDKTKENFMTDMIRAHEFTESNLRTLLGSRQMKELFASNRTFDAVISSTYLFFQSLAIIPYHFNALAIEFMPQSDLFTASCYTGVLINNVAYNPKKSYIWNFAQRAQSTLKITAALLFNDFVVVPRHQEIIEQIYGPAKTSLSRLLYEKSLILANGHSSLASPKYYPVLQKDVAGISIRSHHPVPEEYETFINKSTSGFILLSWGSITSSADGQTGDKIFETLSQLPYQIIWKSTRTNFSRPISKNIMISNWVPQTSLLGDNRIKLFWTHGGLGGMIETIHYGVPVIVTPSSFDQPKNAIHMTTSGMGLVLNLDNFTVDSLTRTIKEVIINPKYKRAASRISTEFKSRPVSPRDEAIFWIESAIAFKTRLPMEFNYGLTIFFFENFDVFIVIMCCILIVFLALRRLFSTFQAHFKKETQSLKKKKK